jgi:hypothetical protein
MRLLIALVVIIAMFIGHQVVDLVLLHVMTFLWGLGLQQQHHLARLPKHLLMFTMNITHIKPITLAQHPLI